MPKAGGPERKAVVASLIILPVVAPAVWAIPLGQVATFCAVRCRHGDGLVSLFQSALTETQSTGC